LKSFDLQIRVRFKEGILDPQSEAITTALKRLEFKTIESIQLEKVFVIRVSAESDSQALQMGREMANKLLANVVMENFEVELKV